MPSDIFKNKFTYEEKYGTNEATTWGVLGWLTSDVCTSPLTNVFTQAAHLIFIFSLSLTRMKMLVFMDIYWLFDFMDILKNIDKNFDKAKINKIHRNMKKKKKKK